MENKAKITTGLNDRPRNETIAQTGAGLPDDSGQPIEVDEAEIEKVRSKLEEMGEGPADKESPADKAEERASGPPRSGGA